jgi:carbon monoxide dehydrogenase subunit G
MLLEGNTRINAPQEKVWNFLTDPHSVSQCAPGLVSVDIIVPEKQFKVVAGVGLGSVYVKFETDIELVELDPPTHARVKAHGKAPGSGVDVLSDMFLSSGSDGATELKWNADIVVVGTIASLASRLMGGVTRKLTGTFFECVKTKIET